MLGMDFDRGITDWPERIAAAVIMQAIHDLESGGDSDARSAAYFLFGPGDPAAGWLGMLGVTPEVARRRIAAYFETRRHSPDPKIGRVVGKKKREVELKRAKDRRRKAHDALMLIRQASRMQEQAT
jgi:hypothetical protein